MPESANAAMPRVARDHVVDRVEVEDPEPLGLLERGQDVGPAGGDVEQGPGNRGAGDAEMLTAVGIGERQRVRPDSGLSDPPGGGDIDQGARVRDQPVVGSDGETGKQRPRPAGKDGGHPVPLRCQCGRAERVDTTMDAMEATGLDERRDPRLGESTRHELRQRQHAVLVTAGLRQSLPIAASSRCQQLAVRAGYRHLAGHLSSVAETGARVARRSGRNRTPL
jgi:hypothetical protein